MPDCVACPKFDKKRQVCLFAEKWNPQCVIRNCVGAFAEEVISQASGKKLLEVGHGVWKGPRILCKEHGVEWNGVDPRWKTNAKARLNRGTATLIPFPDNTFDVVCGFETMEHWREHNDEPVAGLREIHRVLKRGGVVAISVPIHLHGSDEFVEGDVPKILSYFEPGLWSEIVKDEWRRRHEPLPAYKGWLENRLRRHYELLVQKGFGKQEIQKEPSSWSLSITARKKSTTATLKT